MSGLVMTCVDDGPRGAAAARVGAALARRLCSRLVLATVTTSDVLARDPAEPPPSAVARARSVLLRRAAPILADAAAGVGADPELHIELGEPSERLVCVAQQLDADLLVVGVPDRGSAPGRSLGCSYLALSGTSPCPVVAVPPAALDVRASGPIVCGIDGSDDSLAAVRLAIDLGRSLAAPVRLVHVTGQPTLSGTSLTGGGYGARVIANHAAAIRLLIRAAGVTEASFDLRIELGTPAERLADVATRDEAQLLVVGSKGRGGVRTSLMGSVASRLAHEATQPLILARSGVSSGRVRPVRTPTAHGLRRRRGGHGGHASSTAVFRTASTSDK